MYKIYINGTPLYLIEKEEIESVPPVGDSCLHMRFNGKSKHILQVVDMLEKTQRWEAVVFISSPLKTLWKSFKSVFKTIKAAGGLVENEAKEVLWIYRRNFWDLPKGKIDSGEGKKAAALREVNEETGANDLQIEKKLLTTYHTYRTASGKRILKKTFWYLMKAPKQALIPQTEEDIEKALWKSKANFPSESERVYKSIKDVVQSYIPDY